MKIGVVAILLFFLSGCSANWHLNRALEKDPTILVQNADTTVIEKIEYRPVNIFVTDTIEIKVYSDTIRFDTITEFVGYDLQPIYMYSRDSIARAKIWIEKGRLFANVWAVVDTSISWSDSISIMQKQITIEREIRRKTEVELKTKTTFLQKMKILGILVGILILLISVITIFKRR